jgi:uncharacterized membrane protein
MPLSLLVIMNAGLVLAAVIHWIAPLTAHSGLFFGVAVDPKFPGSENGRRLLSRHRRIVVVTTVACIAALWLTVPRLRGIAGPIAIASSVFLEVSVAMISMAVASRHVRPFAKPQSPTRTVTVSILPRKRALPGGWLPLFAPMLIVGAVRWLLFMRRESMPPEAYRGVLALLLVAFVWNALYMWLAWLATFRTRQMNPVGPAANEESAARRMGYWLHLLITYFFNVLMVGTALNAAKITTALAGPRFIVVVMASWLVLASVMVAFIVKRRRLALDTPVLSIADITPDECWKAGFIYYNPDDPALVVETRMGRFGCDLNFGNKWSWVVSGVILATPFVTPFLWF